MLKGVRKTVFDTETTGLDKKEDRIIEVGGVEIIGNIITGRTFHCYIDPGKREVHPEAFKVHGLDNEFLAKNGRPFAEVVEEWEAFIGDDPVIGHNAGDFDMAMFKSEYDRLKRPIFTNALEDTLRQAQKMFPSQQNNLDALCRRFGIDNSNRTLHGALLDSDLLAEVYIAMHGGNRLDLSVTSQTDQDVADSVAALAAVVAIPVSTGLIVSPTDFERAKHREFLDKFKVAPIWNNFLENLVDTAA